MQFAFTRDPAEFHARTEGFLAAALERNVIATILLDALDGRHDDTGQLFAYGLDDDDRIAYAGLRTDSWNLVTSELAPGLVDGFVEQWLHEDPEPPGVGGPPGSARAIADAWARQTDGSTKLRLSERMHVLEEVTDPPRPSDGTLRLATAADRQQLISWVVAFVVETGVSDVGDRTPQLVDSRIRSGRYLVWEDGDPVSMVGVNFPVAGVVRLGPVYTPPELRRRGYAGTAVAAASRRALAQGAKRCMLFTDLANPTSNKIYAEVGYRSVGEWEEHAFERRRVDGRAEALCAPAP